MFAGIGGFRAGLTRAGGFQCVGHCELDKYADASYRAIHDIGKEECYYPDAREIDPAGMPDFDLLCGGFLCLLRIAPKAMGKRKRFPIRRLWLFFASKSNPLRWASIWYRAVSLLLELPQSGSFVGKGGAREQHGFCDGTSQSRRRVFLICYLDPRCAGKILPVFGTDAKALIQVVGGPQGSRVYDPEGVACTQTAGAGGMGGKTGLYLVRKEDTIVSFVDLCAGYPKQTGQARCLTTCYGRSTLCNYKAERSGVLLMKEATKKGYKETSAGDSVNLGDNDTNTRRGRVRHDIAHTLDTGSSTQSIVERGGRIRRLTPRECLRLQGFEDSQIDKILAISSDAQAYKQAGNCVTVNVIEAIARRIRTADEERRDTA